MHITHKVPYNTVVFKFKKFMDQLLRNPFETRARQFPLKWAKFRCGERLSLVLTTLAFVESENHFNNERLSQ